MGNCRYRQQQYEPAANAYKIAAGAMEAEVARMTSMPRALAAGVGLGILEQLLLWNYSRSGLVEASLFVIILVALMVQKRQGGREEEKGSWASVQALPPVSERLLR